MNFENQRVIGSVPVHGVFQVHFLQRYAVQMKFSKEHPGVTFSNFGHTRNMSFDAMCTPLNYDPHPVVRYGRQMAKL